ncbi:MAG: hypothetical protein GY779_12075 [Gammaproteobacteria bacterium]|nr:hypothetical protein [Gammaproteobacteria bacterium]MCP5017221.1 hypothetical protein [Ketobacter sp.]
MEVSPTYRVVFTGKFTSESGAAAAVSGFAALARISNEKAAQVLGAERVLKQGLELKVAHAYREKLEQIGLQVSIQPQKVEKPVLSLSLEPIENEPPADSHNEIKPGQEVVDSPVVQLSADRMRCPKCGHEQDKAAQCDSCGVYVHKVQSAEPALTDRGAAVRGEADSDEPGDPKLISVVTAVVAALVCAYLWLGIAVISEYELGIVAWAIGGVVGFAAIASGSAGMRTGVMCGALALASILGGKLLVVNHFYGEIASALQQELPAEGLFQSYQAYNEMARYYVEQVDTDAELRSFMVHYDFADTDDPDMITSDELDFFRQEEAPILEATAAEPIDVEAFRDLDQLSGSEYAESLLGYSTWDALKEDLGPIDYLFFFLGIATAFRMGASGRLG